MTAIATEGKGTMGLRRLRAVYHEHRDFFLLMALFAALQFMLLAFFGPGGRFGDYSDYWYYAEMAARVDSGYYPYLHYWVEYPPLFPWLPLAAYWLSRILPPASDPLLWFYVVYGAFMGLFAVGNLAMVYLLGLVVHGRRLALRCSGFYALLFGPLFVHAGYFDGVALFFMLLSFYLLFKNRAVSSGLAATIGAMVKVLPLALLPVGFKILPHRWRYLVTVGLGLVAINLPFYLLNPVMFAASWRALATVPSWETVWALLDGYYSYGLAPGNRFDPAQASLGQRPEFVPWSAVLILFGLIYVLLYLLPWQQNPAQRLRARGQSLLRWTLEQFGRPAGADPGQSVYRLGVVGFVGLSLNLFMIFSRGYSPQFVLWYLPFLALALPNGWGLAYATLLTVDSVVERVIYFFVLPESKWLLIGTVLFRTVLMLALVPEYLAVMGFLPAAKWRQVRRFGLTGILIVGIVAAAVGTGAFLRDYRQQRYSASPQRLVVDRIRAAARPGDGVVTTSRATFDAVVPFLPELEARLFTRADGEFRPAAFEAQWSRLLAAQPRIWLLLDYAGGQNADWNDRLARQLDELGFQTTDEWVGPEQRLLHYATAALDVVRTEAVDAVFGDAIGLQSIELDGAPLRGGEVVRMRLIWHVDAASNGQPKVFAHLVSEDGKLHVQRDLPLPSGGQVQRVGLLLPQELAPGSYQLRIGVYDPATGSRLPLTQRAGQSLPPGAEQETLVVEGIEVQ